MSESTIPHNGADADRPHVSVQISADEACLTGLRLVGRRLVLTIEAELEVDGLRLLHPLAMPAMPPTPTGAAKVAEKPAAYPPPAAPEPEKTAAPDAGIGEGRPGEPRAEVDWALQIPRPPAAPAAVEADTATGVLAGGAKADADVGLAAGTADAAVEPPAAAVPVAVYDEKNPRPKPPADADGRRQTDALPVAKGNTPAGVALSFEPLEEDGTDDEDEDGERSAWQRYRIAPDPIVPPSSWVNPYPTTPPDEDVEPAPAPVSVPAPVPAPAPARIPAPAPAVAAPVPAPAEKPPESARLATPPATSDSAIAPLAFGAGTAVAMPEKSAPESRPPLLAPPPPAKREATDAESEEDERKKKKSDKDSTWAVPLIALEKDGASQPVPVPAGVGGERMAQPITITPAPAPSPSHQDTVLLPPGVDRPRPHAPEPEAAPPLDEPPPYEFAIPPSPVPPAPPPPPPAAPESKAAAGAAANANAADPAHLLIRYTCPRCHHQGVQPAGSVGQVVRCGHCGKTMRLVMK